MSERQNKNRRSVEAKLALAQSFVELAETTSIDDITVNMVVEGLGSIARPSTTTFPASPI